MPDNHTLSKEELQRYSRHLLIPEFNVAGQRKLKSARVLVIGAGGLGCPALLYLAAAGVGTIGIVDDDVVDQTNLQRQVLYDVHVLGQPKAQAAQTRLQALNPYVSIERHEVRLTAANAMEVLQDYDVILDGTDNFPTRYLVNDACLLLDKPLVYGSIFQFEGQVSVFNLPDGSGGRGPNYRDLFPTPPPPGMVPSCAEGGVLGVLPGIIGSLQANEVIKIITGIGQTLSGRLHIFDALTFHSVTLNVQPSDPPVVVTALIDYDEFCGIGSQKEVFTGPEISVQELRRWQQEQRDFQLIDVRRGSEYDIANLQGVLIPLDTLREQVSQIDRDRPVVVHCRSGQRSRQAQEILIKEFGHDNIYNLAGGILAYADEIDTSLVKY